MGKNRKRGTLNNFYKQPVEQNALQEAVVCFVLLLVLPKSVKT